jgi:hypothetical protein
MAENPVNARWAKTSKRKRKEIAQDLNAARNQKLSAKRRSELAKKAAETRWNRELAKRIAAKYEDGATAARSRRAPRRSPSSSE